MAQLTREEAVAFGQSGKWRTWDPLQLVRFQLGQDRLCVDLGVFRAAIEAVLGCPVWTHEFANPKRLLERVVRLHGA